VVKRQGNIKKTLPSLVSIAQYHQITFRNDNLNYKFNLFYEAEIDSLNH